MAKTPNNDSNGGYIKLFRSIKSHWLWKDTRKKTPFEAWVDLMLRAQYTDGKEAFGVDFVTLERGQILTSQLQLSKSWGWTRKAVTAFLRALERDSMVVVECTNKWSKLTICNYESYQGTGAAKVTAKEQQKEQQAVQQGDTYKKEEERKKKEKIYSAPFEDEKLNETWRAWVEYRRQKKEPLTEIGATRQINKTKSWPVDFAIGQIEKAIERGWKGFGFDPVPGAPVISIPAKPKVEMEDYFTNRKTS